MKLKKYNIMEWVLLGCALFLMYLMFTRDMDSKTLALYMVSYLHTYNNITKRN